MLFMFCVCHVFESVHLLPCGHLPRKGSSLGSCCNFVTFPCGILGQVWYLIVLIPDFCRISYFDLCMEESTCHEIVIYLSQRFSSMFFLALFM